LCARPCACRLREWGRILKFGPVGGAGLACETCPAMGRLYERPLNHSSTLTHLVGIDYAHPALGGSGLARYESPGVRRTNHHPTFVCRFFAARVRRGWGHRTALGRRTAPSRPTLSLRPTNKTFVSFSDGFSFLGRPGPKTSSTEGRLYVADCPSGCPDFTKGRAIGSPQSPPASKRIACVSFIRLPNSHDGAESKGKPGEA